MNSRRWNRRRLIFLGSAGLTGCVAGCLGELENQEFDPESASLEYYQAISDADWNSIDDILHPDADIRSWYIDVRSSDSDPEVRIRSPDARPQEAVVFDTIDVESVEVEEVTEFEGVREVETNVVWQNDDGRETRLRETLDFRRDDSGWVLWDSDPEALLTVHEAIGPCPASPNESPIAYVSRQTERAAEHTYQHINSVVTAEFASEDGYATSIPDDLEEVGIRFPFEFRLGNYNEIIIEIDDAISTVTRNRDEIQAAQNALESCSVPEEDLVESALRGTKEKTDLYVEAGEQMISAAETYLEQRPEQGIDDWIHISQIPGPQSARDDLIEAVELIIQARKTEGVPGNLREQLESASR